MARLGGGLRVQPAQSQRKWLRTCRVLSVLACVVTIIVLSSATDIILESIGVIPSGPLYDTGHLLLATAYCVVYSVLPSYLVARLAPDYPMRHALAFGGGLVFSTLGVIVTIQMQLGAMWYPVLLVAVTMPCGWCGGKLFEATSRPSARRLAELQR